jgi:hypothetical protein
MQQEMALEQKRDKKLAKISKKWKEEIKQKDEEKKKILEDTKAERKAQRQKEREKRKQKYDNLVKHNEERIKEKQEKLEEMAEQMKQRSREERDANKGKRDQWKQNNEEFLEQQKEKLQKEMEALAKEREELTKIKAEFENKEKETVEAVKGQVMKYFKSNKDKLKQEKKEKEQVNKFINKKAVKEVFDRYDIPLRYFFEFYSRSEHHQISHNLHKDMETMDFKEFIRFGYQTHIVPVLLPIDEMKSMFKQLVRQRQDENKEESMQVLDYDYFLKALVRIAALGQDNLGGQKGKKLEVRMEELKKEKQRTQKLKKTLAKKYAKNNKSMNGSETSLERGAETDGNETGQETDKSRGEIYKRGAKKPRKKVKVIGLKDATLKNTTVLKNVVSEADLLKRKTKNVNAMLQEGTKVEVLEHIKHVKVEDRRITKSVDVSLITEKTIEALLNYLHLLPEDNKYTLDKKLNQERRDFVGVKPNRLAKTIKPKKAEVVDRDSSDEDEQTGDKSDASPATNKSKTEKTDKTGNSDSESDGATSKN